MSTLPTTDPLATASVGDARQAIAFDLACECGYNLRGLSFDARCPECGTKLSSLPRRTLAIDGRWARRAAWGLVLLIPLHVPVMQMALYRGFYWLALLASAAAAAAAAAGAVLVSAREPNVRQTMSDNALRWLFRLTCFAWLAVLSLLYLGERWQLLRSIKFTSQWFTPIAFELLIYILNAFMLYAAIAQFDQLALRIKQRDLARWFVLLRFVVPLSAAAPALLRVPGLNFSSQVSAMLRLGQQAAFVASLFVLGRLYHALRSETPPRLR